MEYRGVSRLFSFSLAAALGLAALLPGKAHAGDDLVRILVDVADVIYRGGQPYYHDRNYGRYEQVVVVRDRYHRPAYFRYAPRNYLNVYRAVPPYGHAYGYHRSPPARYVRYDRDYRDYRRHDRRDDWHHDRRGYKGKDTRRGRDRDDD